MDIGLVYFALHRVAFIKELQTKHNVFIGGCPQSKSIYICGGTEKLRQDLLRQICEESIYSDLAYCNLQSNEFENYIFHSDTTSHFKPLRKLHNKRMQTLFVYNDDGTDSNKIQLVTPSLFESDCNAFIANILQPSLLKMETNQGNMALYEYITLMSKLSNQKDFLSPHVAMDEKGENLYIFHRKLSDETYRKYMKNEIIRYQQMKHYAIGISTIYPWLRQYLHRILKHAVHWDSTTALITLLNEDKTLNIRCNERMYDKLKNRLDVVMNRVFMVPICERLHWMEYYEMNNNVQILKDADLWMCSDENGMHYLYNRDYLKCIAWIDRYLGILLQIGLTFNQFPNDEHILQRDCDFLLHLLPKFNYLPYKTVLFAHKSIINFVLLMVYQCVLSTRYDLLIAVWQCVNGLDIENNILIPNVLNTIFVVGGKEFTSENMKSFLVESKILFDTKMMQFVMKILKDNEKREELKQISLVLDEIHIDEDVNWTFKDIDWNI